MAIGALDFCVDFGSNIRGVSGDSLFVSIMISRFIVVISGLNRGYTLGLMFLFLVTVVNSVSVFLAAVAE